jgi:RNA polymerase-binding protein DksA
MIDTTKARQTLQELRKTYTKRHAALDKDLHHVDNPVEKDFAEQATQMENQQVLEALDVEAQSLVAQIDGALKRIDEGRYGICIKCGEPIAENRVETIPYVSLCITCATEND